MENQNQMLAGVQQIEHIMARLKIGESVDYPAATDASKSSGDEEPDSELSDGEKSVS